MTGRCTDSRFEALLYPYQLGMLSAEDSRLVELHLLECENCYNRVLQFESAAEMLRDDKEVRQEILTLASLEAEIPETESLPSVQPDQERKAWPVWSRVALVLAAAVVVLAIIPWQMRVTTTDETVAQEPRLAVAYFKDLSNAAASDSLCPIVTNLIATDLSQSRFLQVVPESRLKSALLLSGHQPACGIDDSVSEGVARSLDVKWLVTGVILQTRPRYELVVSVVSLKDGRLVGSRRIEGPENDDVFGIVDQITLAVKSLLPLPDSARKETDKRVADVTTHSPEAYRCYLEGIELAYKYYFDEAIRKFRQAVEIDTAFAMAYYYLARYQSRSYLPKAVYYSSSTTEKEQLYIKSLQAEANGRRDQAVDSLLLLVKRYPDELDAMFLLGQYFGGLGLPSKSVYYCRKGLELDPTFKLAHCYMAYGYSRMGFLDSALSAADKYIEFASDEPNPYDTKGDILAAYGHFVEAIAVYRQALAIRPDFARYETLGKIGQIALFSGDYVRADSAFDLMARVPSMPVQSTGTYYKAAALTQQGKFDSALHLLDSSIAVDEQMRDYMGVVSKRAAKAFVNWEIGRPREAVAEMRRSVETRRVTEPRDVVGRRPFLVLLLIESGDLFAAQASADSLRRDIERTGFESANFGFGLAVTALALGRTDSAITLLRILGNDLESGFPALFLLGRTLLANGQYAEAAATFESARTRFQSWRISLIAWNSLIEYYLGCAYEGLGQTREAIAAYQTFVERMQHASPPPTALADATARLQRLRNRP